MKLPTGKRLRAWSIAAAVAFLLAQVVADWINPSLSYVTVTPPPVTLTETRLSERIVEKRVEVPVYVKVPTPKQEAKLEEKYDVDLGPGWLMGEVRLPKLPDGGDALVRLDSDGQLAVKVAPKRAPFFAFGGAWSVGGGVVYGPDGIGATAVVEKELFRVGRVTARGSITQDAYPNQIHPPTLRLMAVWRF